MNRKRWGVAFWMPYDNNLSVYEESILGQLRAGMQQDIALAIQIDRPGGNVMQRYLMTADETRTDQADTADGSSAEALSDFLSWVGTSVTADHWALVFLGHGGKVNEFSPDDDVDGAGRPTARRWMGPEPGFRDISGNAAKYRGLHVVYSAQCPMVPKSVADLSEMAAEHGLDLNVTVLSTPQEAQAAPSYYGVFSLLWNGRLLSDHYVSNYILRDEIQQESR